VIEGLLAVDYVTGNPEWAERVVTACRDGIINCATYAPLVAERARAAAPQESARLARLQSMLRCEIDLEAKSRDERREVYRAALRRSDVGERQDCDLNWVEICRRASVEGMPELIAEAEVARARRNDRTGGSKLTIYKALTSSEPDRDLLLILRRSASYEVSLAQKTQQELSAEYETTQAELGVGHLALTQLRRRNPPGLVDELRSILRLYDPVRDQYSSEMKQFKMPGERGSSPAAKRPFPLTPTSYLMGLGWEIAEAIGDLGDRDLERRTLGGRTLWDQVHEAEKTLVERGKIRRSEMVSE
jgi:hypothetical protein